MPEPRYPVDATAAIRITLEPGSRDLAAAKRRNRAGTGSGRGARALPVEVRNGLPAFKPYVYRGTGTDTLTPHLGDDNA